MKKEAARIAGDLSEYTRQLSLFIQPWCDEACPACKDVCCRDRFSVHDPIDRFFLSVRELKMPGNADSPAGAGPCRFMGSAGCVLERDMRPYRCNWFFCSSLMAKIEENVTPGEYRFFIALLEKITRTRSALAELSALPGPLL